MKGTTPMTTRFHLLAIALLVSIFPVLVYADAETTSDSEAVEVSEGLPEVSEASCEVSEASNETARPAEESLLEVPSDESEPITEPVFEQPVAQSCSYSCTPPFGIECPNIIGFPRPQCINNCCVYG